MIILSISPPGILLTSLRRLFSAICMMIQQLGLELIVFCYASGLHIEPFSSSIECQERRETILYQDSVWLIGKDLKDGLNSHRKAHIL